MDHRLHVAHVVLSLQPGGLENGVVNVVNGIDPARFRSSVLCLKVAGEFAGRIRAPDAEVHAFGLRQGNDLRLPWRLARHLRRHRVDVVHTRNAESFFYGSLAAKLAGVPRLIHSEHGRTFNDRPLRFWAQRQLTRLADTVFALSEQLRRDLVTHVGLPAERIEVLYNGVDLARFGGSGRVEARRRLALDETAPVVGSVGRLVAVKNYPLLLRAIAQPALAHATLVLIGDGPERPALQSLADGLGIADRVRFVGHREDVADLLPAFDLFVLPSRSEGMSNTLLEAMACSVPAVASRVGGNAEIVRDGLDGLLFPSDDEAALRDALAQLVSDAQRRAQMGAASRERVMSAFDIRAMMRAYESVYERGTSRLAPSASPSCPA
jgi:sugar transferase (PEP-CTERM/EpsH1 system associated)